MKLGILGGGQLGRMLAEAASNLGVEVLVIDPNEESSAASVAPVLRESFDSAAVEDALSGCDAVTYEFEGVPLDVCRKLESRVPIFPNPRALEVVRDRLVQKRFLRDLEIATAEFRSVSGPDELEAALVELGFPAILKTRQDGYDGKGQWRIQNRADAEQAAREVGTTPAILEAFVPFDRELSLIAVRDASGAIQTWAPTENVHVGGILRLSRSPLRGVAEQPLLTGDAWFERLGDTLDYRGVITLELFDVGGRWLVNEMACRVHNSGHWTLDGAETSQFENHVRAVLGQPVGSTASRGASAMVNLIGALAPETAVHSVTGARFYDYEKSPRALRKLGHINLNCTNDAARDEGLRSLVGAIGDRELSRALSALEPSTANPPRADRTRFDAPSATAAS
ncbi:MAG: 5-(carboxyamino)imidazole ribonucleotide synthase [Myxococcota bacterium]